MASSFDRASQTARPGQPEWFANHDAMSFSQGEPLVLLDARGPGVVTRIWSANPSGTLRIYLDGATRPALEAPMRELLMGRWQPIAAPFAFEAARGGNLYLPIAYRSRCLITVTSDARKLYYQVSHRTYAPDVELEPFDLATFADPNGQAQQLGRMIDGPYRVALPRTSQVELGGRGEKQYSLAAEPGGSLLRELRVQLIDSQSEALRRTVFEIWVDGERTVRAPLGDFFGGGPGLQTVRAVPFGIDAERGELVSRWPMPFARELRVVLSASGADPVAARFELSAQAHRFEPDSLLFYAQWRPPEWHASEPTHEYTLAQLNGDGVYVGTVLNVANSVASWWGEGDEKIWVDADTFPSFFGTGTEDYFGYAYCSNERFSQLYVGQPLSGEQANFGRSALYRFHIPDPIRFTRQLRFDLEVRHWDNEASPVSYDSIVYFYARPGAKITPAASDDASFRIPALHVPKPDTPPAGPYRCGG